MSYFSVTFIISFINLRECDSICLSEEEEFEKSIENVENIIDKFSISMYGNIVSFTLRMVKYFSVFFYSRDICTLG